MSQLVPGLAQILRRRTLGRMALLATIAISACNRVGRDGDAAETHLELRDAQGELRLAVYRTGEGFRWQDRADGSEGRLTGSGTNLRGLDPRRGMLEASAAGPGEVMVRGPEGVRLKLRRDEGGLRLGDGAEIPLCRVRLEGEQAVVRDAGGTVQAFARPGGGRIVLTDRAGRTTGFVLGDLPLERAALAAVSPLSAGERVMLLLGPSP